MQSKKPVTQSNAPTYKVRRPTHVGEGGTMISAIGSADYRASMLPAEV